MMKGYLRLIVMKTLSNKKLSGYDLIKEIEKSTGTWKPSFGSIYPLLEKLLDEELVKFESRGRKKIYFLTEKGRKNLQAMDKGKNRLADSLTAAWNSFGKITNKDERGFMLEVINSIRKGQLPLKEFNPELNELRATMYQAYIKKKNPKIVKGILRTAIIKLKSIK